VDLNVLFKNYVGGADFEKACTFIATRFRERVANDTQVFIHFTCAINTENIEFVIHEVRRKVLDRTIDQIVI